MTLLLLSVSIGYASTALKAQPKTAKRIKWSSPYYTSEFEACKPLRILNAVEKMKAQKLAVDVFRQCGAKIMQIAAFKYKFPSYGESNGTSEFTDPLERVPHGRAI